MSKLLELIETLNGIFRHVSVRIALEVISHLDRIGAPPAIADKDSLRHWLQGLLPVLDTVSEATPTDLDDHAAALIRVAIEDDAAWNALYGLLSAIESGWSVEAAREGRTARVLADRMEFDTDTITEIIKLILRFIELLKK